MRIAPSSINGFRGTASVPLTVYALRKDGFSGEIVLRLKDAPDGFALSGGCVPAGQEKTRLTLTVPATSLTGAGEPVAGGASDDRRPRGRSPGRAGGRHDAGLRLPASRSRQRTEGGRLDPPRSGPALSIRGKTPVQIPAGGTVRVQLGVSPGTEPLLDRFRFELDEPPEGIAVRKVTPAGEGIEIVLQADAAKSQTRPEGEPDRRCLRDGRRVAKKAKLRPNRPRAAVGMLPAIPFEVVGR